MQKESITQLKALIDPELPLVSNLSNTAAFLWEALDEINWAGFYLLKEETLYLGPFQGKVACTRIQIGKGVCGTAAQEAKTQLVEDVHQFPGHIACDSASNSEIVVPIIIDKKVVGVLDIDSPKFARFKEEDRLILEELVHILEQGCNWKSEII
ncbi:GAF domain-containing protein [Konateibacter massiliensis]|uniref:GAF domain-containing protein n=1 Tax=Konateibacter massiliensis TaxID=2002841 RepID=UPI000C1521F1|nr:GAF domain-containing protein [Konateibacter massiliensis]